MIIEKDFKIYIKIPKDNSYKFIDTSKTTKLFLREKDILEMTWIKKKQLDLYLYRHPEIKREKHNKEKLISSKILYYIMKYFERKK